MSIEFNDTQLGLLNAASQRDDRCLIPPQNTKRGSFANAAEKLLAAGLVKEIKTKGSAPIWRRDEESGQSYSLKLTPAGAKAIAVDTELSLKDGAQERGDAQNVATATTLEPEPAPSTASIGLASSQAGAIPTEPRSGTKIAAVISLLQRDGGATLNDLVAATGWLAHTTRAALTGLRKRGYAVTIDRSEKARGSVYVIHSAAQVEPVAALSGKEDTAAEAAPDKPTPKASPRIRRAA